MTTNSNTYFNRTQGTATSNKKGTFSAWIKGMVPGETNSIFTGYTDNNNKIYLYLSDRLQIYGEISGSQSVYIQTTAVFRDIAAWYHVVVAWDTTQGTSSNRFKIYVNGEQITTFDTASYPAQDADVYWNKGTTSLIGARYVSSIVNYFYGNMAAVVFVDGTQLTPTSFGETDTTSGIWKYKGPAGFTYGDNGFFLKFENNSNLGLDTSGETNNFTLNGNGKESIDTPVISYPTYNFLAQAYTSGSSLTNGNLTMTNTSGVGQRQYISTFGIETGKWYAEFKLVAIGSTSGSKPYVGVTSYRDYVGNTYVGGAPGCGLHTGGDIYQGAGSPVSTGTSYTTGDIIGVAVDRTNSLIYWHKNGTYVSNGSGTGNPSTGANGFNISTTTAKGGTIGFATSLYDNGGSWSANFGAGFFGTTAVTSNSGAGEQDDAGEGIFQYDVPSGYYALNTKNINTYG